VLLEKITRTRPETGKKSTSWLTGDPFTKMDMREDGNLYFYRYWDAKDAIFTLGLSDYAHGTDLPFTEKRFIRFVALLLNSCEIKILQDMLTGSP
jgi:hypothetical protein